MDSQLRRRLSAAAIAIGFLSAASGAQTQQGETVPVVVLESRGTLWRYFETWQTDVARPDTDATGPGQAGKLVRVDPLNPWVPQSKQVLRKVGARAHLLRYAVQATSKVMGSKFPPKGWERPDFDDSEWMRRSVPFRNNYRGIALICLRGKFEVKDPAQVHELLLDATIQGGAVFYLNGQEVGRVFLPPGTIDYGTPAEDYPKEAFVGPGGDLLPGRKWSTSPMTEAEFRTEHKDPQLQARYKKRFRHVNLKIPASTLRKGSNVLAIEVHRSPANEVMFTMWRTEWSPPDQRGKLWWDRATVEGVKLTAAAAPEAVMANRSRPKGIRVWNHPIMWRLDRGYYGEPNEPLAPIKLYGARNAVYAGQVIVGSTKPVKDLKVSVADLKGTGQKIIPASAIEVRFVHVSKRSNALEAFPPEASTFQPIWFTVHVPKDAGAGDYVGKVTITAQGQTAAEAPIQLHVSDWTVPDPQDFVTQMAITQSPDTVAMQYDVPMWSEKHWQLLDKSFELLGNIGNKHIYIPLKGKSTFGNEHGMVYWIRQADGTYKPDLHVAERYIDLAVKHLGKIPAVVFVCVEIPFRGWTPAQAREQGEGFTELHAATGELKEGYVPKWGTQQTRDFLKPAFDELSRILAKHGIEGSMMLGFHKGDGAGHGAAVKVHFEDFKGIAPHARWVSTGHCWHAGPDGWDDAGNGLPYGFAAAKGSAFGVFWDPDEEKPIYGWKNPQTVLSLATIANYWYAGVVLKELPAYRLFAEGCLLSGRRTLVGKPRGIGNPSIQFGVDKFMGLRGVGLMGGDYWPVLGKGPKKKPLCDRYAGGFQRLGINIRSILEPGKEGPVSSVRAELMRESLQEAEARVFVQNTLLDETMKAKLGTDLAARAKALCDERTRLYRYYSEFWASSTRDAGVMVDPAAWQEHSRRLYEMAAEVAEALKQAKRMDPKQR